MPDDSLDILVRTRADVSGAQKAEDSLKGVKKAAQETKSGLLDGLNPALANYGQQAERVATKTEKLTGVKRQLKDAVRGLALQFPILGQIAGLALNPITLAVTAIAGAFVIFRKRVDELTKSLAGVELPDISDSQVGRIQKAIDIYGEFNKVLAAAVENYRSANAESDRFAKAIDRHAKNAETLIKAQKELDLANLEGMKGELPAGEYELRKAGIEDEYAARGLTLDENTRRAQLAEKARLGGNLLIEAARKVSEAEKIRTGQVERESAVEEKAKKHAVAAEEDNVIRKKRLGEMADYRGGSMPWLKRKAFDFQFTQRYGYGTSMDEAEALERGHVSDNDSIIGRYNNFLGRKEGWAESRQRRNDITAEVGSRSGQAFAIMADLPGDKAALDKDVDVRNREQSMQNLARAVTVNVKLKEIIIKELEALRTATTSADGNTIALLTQLTTQKQKQEEKIVTLRNVVSKMRAE